MGARLERQPEFTVEEECLPSLFETRGYFGVCGGLDVVAGLAHGAVEAGARPHAGQRKSHRRKRACMGQPGREPGQEVPAPFRLQHRCVECLVTVVHVF